MSKIYSKWYNQCLYWRRFVDRDARKAMFTNVTCLWRHGDSTIARGKPHHHNRVHGTTWTLWIDGGALTNHQCSLATGRGNKFYTNIYDDPAVEFFWVSFPFLEHRNTYIFIKSAHWILSMHIRLYWNGLFWYVQSGYMWIIYIYMYIYIQFWWLLHRKLRYRDAEQGTTLSVSMQNAVLPPATIFTPGCYQLWARHNVNIMLLSNLPFKMWLFTRTIQLII